MYSKIEFLPFDSENARKLLDALGSELRHKNRFRISDRAATLAGRFIDHYLNTSTATVPVGSVFKRARINEVGQNNSYEIGKMGAPPESVVTSGRINPEGISYLYISESAETAIAEVRPWRGALVSVGEFEIRKELQIVSLVDGEQGSILFDSADVEVTKDRFKNSIFAGALKSLYFSTPAHGNDKLAYLPSQYLAECFKHAGIDGIKYSSVLRDGGVNLVLFEPDVAECKSVMQYRVDSVEYSSLPI